MSVLETRNLVKRFDAVLAVDDLSFAVAPGEIFGFLGGNGAGKTTTLRMVLDIVRPTSGSISLFGALAFILPAACYAVIAGFGWYARRPA